MQITLILMQQRYVMKISERRRVRLANNTPNTNIQINRQKNQQTIGTNNLMTSGC